MEQVNPEWAAHEAALARRAAVNRAMLDNMRSRSTIRRRNAKRLAQADAVQLYIGDPTAMQIAVSPDQPLPDYYCRVYDGDRRRRIEGTDRDIGRQSAMRDDDEG